MKNALMMAVIFVAGAELASAQDTYRDPYPYTSYYNEQWTGHSNLFMGFKNLDKDDWGTLDRQIEIAWLNDFRAKDWPVSMAIDFRIAFSGDTEDFGGTDIELDATTIELNIGVRKIFMEKTKIRPFVGAGLSLQRASASFEFGSASASESGVGIGYWMDAGVYIAMSRGFMLGLELSYSQAEVDMDGTDVQAGGFQVGFSLGGHF